jgi:hypothetical protein
MIEYNKSLRYLNNVMCVKQMYFITWINIIFVYLKEKHNFHKIWNITFLDVFKK